MLPINEKARKEDMESQFRTSFHLTPFHLNVSGNELQPFLAAMSLFLLFPQIEETGSGRGSSAMVAATATRRGAATGTISMSSTGTRTIITGTGGTWTATVLGATGPTTCPGRDPTTSTAATGTTGDTEIIMTGVTLARSCTVYGGERAMDQRH